MEGAEFMDLNGENHGQNNFVRGACKQGIMPCNGMIYVPADQCFCQPGAKLLGFAAVSTDEVSDQMSTPVDRVTRGPAWGSTDAVSEPHPGDWPTYRHDPARHASSPTSVAANLKVAWKTQLAGSLTAPVSVGNRVYVAARDAHTIYALNANNGTTDWSFIANGRVDSPPTIHNGTVLFGSADGHVYCLRADDGELIWKFFGGTV